jgi:arylsulfatase A-like enzyme
MKTVSVALLALQFLFFSAFPAMGKKPNVIVVLVDDMGYSDLGSFGGEVKTPHLDRLAAHGLRFTQNYNSARCCPSRASLLTGLYSHQAGIANFTGRDTTDRLGPAYLGKLNKQCMTLAEVLNTAGYGTYGVGKWHVGHEAPPTDRGFDEYYGYIRGHSTSQWKVGNYMRLPAGRTPEIKFNADSFYATDAFNDYAVEFLKQAQQKDSPFFLYLAHSSPHFPLHAPAKTRDRYLDTYRKGWDVLRKERFDRQRSSGLVTDSWKFTGLSEVPVDGDAIANHYAGKPNPDWKDLPENRREDLAYRMATFAAMIDHVDQGIGKIIRQLEQGGDLENTLILFTSDNGACYEWGPFGFDRSSRKGFTQLHEGDDLRGVGGPETYHSVGSAWSCLSNTPLRMYKHFNHEGGNCSPLLAHWPKGISKPNRWVRSPIHLIDVMPTLLEVGGTSYPKKFNEEELIPVEGKSLTPFFKGAESAQDRVLCFDHFDSSAIRKGDWKLVRGNNRYKKRTWELYNLAEDRCETNNLIEARADKAKELEAEWLAWAKRVKVNPYYLHAQANPAKVMSKLKKNTQGFYLLGHGEQVAREHAPNFTQKSIEIRLSVTRGNEKGGVLISHGGSRSGYSLYLEDGKPVFSCRLGGTLHTFRATKALPKERSSLSATIESDGKVSLRSQDEVLASGKLPTLFNTHPQDPLEVGNDSQSTVANYSSSPLFKGKVNEAKLKLR